MNVKTVIRQIVLPERDFWKQVLKFGTSIALQNLTVALFGMIDVSIISDIMLHLRRNSIAFRSEILYILRKTKKGQRNRY